MSGPPAARLVLDSQLAETRRIGAWLDDCADATADAIRRRMELAAVELVTNAVVHAFAGEAGHAVVLELRLSEASLTLVIEYAGTAPPASTLLEPWEAKPPDSVQDLPEHGMGLQMVRALTDACAVEHAADRTRLVLRFDVGDRG